MASKESASKTLLPSFNLLFFFFFTLLTFVRSSAVEQPACGGNFVELDVCVDVFRALSRGNTPSKNYCCSLVGNLVQLEANGACLCTALEVNVLDVIKREIPAASLSLLFEYCWSELPPDFQCRILPSYYSM
ncbi:14 kDa proline-rich protein DC2.15 [Melia azedarach]|uniref:14 kDa proline-rich protein DC2.15 n=1 Tax=Melia azedarach TaxID=155640 RepID=A0ACC1X3B8_MELAZ|nr:14 kDa proline-rich protein DC2.15 [Melia azedarach]